MGIGACDDDEEDQEPREEVKIINLYDLITSMLQVKIERLLDSGGEIVHINVVTVKLESGAVCQIDSQGRVTWMSDENTDRVDK